MAALVLINARVEIATIDMSQHVTAVEIPVEADEVGTTTFGTNGWKTMLPGLKSAECKISWNDDFAVTTVDDRLWGWFGTVQAVRVRATTAAISATNPSYDFSVVVKEFTPVAGKVGDLATQDVSWPVTGAVVRSVA